MDTYLALDLGGTKLLIAEVTEDGTILRSKQYKSAYRTQQEGVAGILASLTDYYETVGRLQTRYLALTRASGPGADPACRDPDRENRTSFCDRQ